MKYNKDRQRVSGFTLIEMIIVMGIITVLIAVLVPAMNGYITRSRLNTANANAKVLFNSVQTIMQEYEIRERQQRTSAFYGEDKTGTLYLAGVDGQITATDGGDTTDTTSAAFVATLGAAGADAPAGTFGSRLARLFADFDQVAWAVYIENYTVRGVVCADTDTTLYVGAYPLRTTEKVGDPGCEISATVSRSDMAAMAAYSTVAWSTTEG